MVYYRTCFGKSPSIYRSAHSGCLPATFFAHPLHAFHWNLAQCASPQLPDRPSAIGRCCTSHRSGMSAHQSYPAYQSRFRKIPFREVSLSPPYPPQGGLVLFCKRTKSFSSSIPKNSSFRKEPKGIRSFLFKKKLSQRKFYFPQTPFYI